MIRSVALIVVISLSQLSVADDAPPLTTGLDAAALRQTERIVKLEKRVAQLETALEQFAALSAPSDERILEPFTPPTPGSLSPLTTSPETSPENSTVNLESRTALQQRWPSDWGGGPVGYDVMLDTETRLSGDSSVRLSKNEVATKHKFGTIVQVIDAAKFAGKRLRLSGYVKTKEVNDHAGLWLRVDSSDRGTVAFDNMGRRPITGTNDWYKYEIVLDVPQDGAMINFGALVHGHGTIWVDDLSLEVVSDATETTSEAMQPTSRKIEIPSSLSQEPKNLSFEA